MDDTLVERVAADILPVYCPQICGRVETPWHSATSAQRRQATDAARAALDAIIEPTEVMWSGLARDLIMWMDMNQRPTGQSLYVHLERCGRDVPDWLRKEVPDIDHVPSKGTRAVIIYKAMLAVAQEEEG